MQRLAALRGHQKQLDHLIFWREMEDEQLHPVHQEDELSEIEELCKQVPALFENHLFARLQVALTAFV